MDMARLLAAKEHRQRGNILGLADTAQPAFGQSLRAYLLHRFVLCLGELLEQLLHTVGLSLTRMDDIDIDVIAIT